MLLISTGFIIGFLGALMDLHELYFYMGSDQFGEMQVPAIPSEHWGTLTLHGGLLAMLTGDPRKPVTSIYNVWVMKEEKNLV